MACGDMFTAGTTTDGDSMTAISGAAEFLAVSTEIEWPSEPTSRPWGAGAETGQANTATATLLTMVANMDGAGTSGETEGASPSCRLSTRSRSGTS